ncbi:hypothetical protein ACWEQC_21025 [Streptomyces shenzhenensis]
MSAPGGAVDYAVRWRLSGQRLRFVRTHGLDTLLRPLRCSTGTAGPGWRCTRA